MRKLFILLLSVITLTVFAQQKKVAVYVTGEQSGVTKILGDQLVSAFSQSGEYTAIERTSSFLAELGKEQNYQRTGAVADSDISRLGKQFGVQYVCVADISEAFGEKYISARLINVESAEVAKTANTSSKLDSMNELIKVSSSLRNQLVEGESNSSKRIPQGYVDLGLPSKTLWKSENEEGLYTYEQAMLLYCFDLPTKEQLMELKRYCIWIWTGNGYKVNGPNQQSIILPAEGHKDGGSSSYESGNEGYYWTSTPYKYDYAYSLRFNRAEQLITDLARRLSCSVRLVKKINDKE